MNPFKCIGFCLVLSINLAQCQINKYEPGFDFELFKSTPVYGLAKAVERDDTMAIESLAGIDSNSIDYKEPKFGHTLLLLAVVDNKEFSVTKLLDLGADPNSRSFDDSSPLLAACQYADILKIPPRILLLLIDHGADVNCLRVDTTNDQFGKRKNFKTTPLGLACSYGNLAYVKILVEHGADLNNYGKNEHAILSTAVLGLKLDIVRYLMIDRGASIPDYVTIRQEGSRYEKKMTITDLLNENHFEENSQEEKLKQEILKYLSKQGKQ